VRRTLFYRFGRGDAKRGDKPTSADVGEGGGHMPSQ
jgi:hypothetical protein